jgi:hypothetical protein
LALERAERVPDERVERERLAVLPPLRLLALLRLPELLLALLREPLEALLREPVERLPLERDDLLRPDEPLELEPLLLAWGIASPSWDEVSGRSTSYPFARAMRAT